jgi:hypothetical protein
MEAMRTETAESLTAPTLALDDRYLREEGRVYLSGMHALVRLPIDESRRDRRARLRIGTFTSGYPGSPLLPESIRGDEDIKLRSIAKVRGQALTLMSRDSTRDSTSHST